MSKYVVILEHPNGYMDCVAIEEDENKAYGIALNILCDGVDDMEECYVTIPCNREGDNGVVIYCKNIVTGELINYCTILYFDE